MSAYVVDGDDSSVKENIQHSYTEILEKVLDFWFPRVNINNLNDKRRGPAQDVPSFYTPPHFSELQSCKSIISTDFLSFSYLNSARHNLVIELWRALFFNTII